MKKILSLFLTLAVLAASMLMVSCEDKKLSDFQGMTPEEAYAGALDAFADVENYTVTHSQTVSTSAFLIFRYSTESNITCRNDGLDYHQTVVCPEAPELEGDTYYVDEYYYDATSMEKYHIPYDQSDYYIVGDENALLKLPAEWLVESSFYSAKGETYIKLVIDGGEYYDFLFENDMESPIDGEADGDVIYCIYFTEEGTVNKITINMDFIAEEDGIKVKGNFTDVITYTDIGTTVVTPPDDADDYTLCELY